MSEETVEAFRALGELSKQRRAANRVTSPLVLQRAGIAYESNNDGAHLVCRYGPRTADFWPGTGKWKVRGGASGRGVFKLVRAFGALLGP